MGTRVGLFTANSGQLSVGYRQPASPCGRANDVLRRPTQFTPTSRYYWVLLFRVPRLRVASRRPQYTGAPKLAYWQLGPGSVAKMAPTFRRGTCSRVIAIGRPALLGNSENVVSAGGGSQLN
ncbi:hypothetical protein BHM03_00021602 [Ensete ventricosum]|nr:hypothetical protein BHM03_00021602 [Ensete ventricosum]